jgi:hypothetical protein
MYAAFNGADINFDMGGDFVINEFTIAQITGIVAVAMVAGFLFFLLKAVEFFLIFYASVKNSNGENYKYPLTINFIK